MSNLARRNGQVQVLGATAVAITTISTRGGSFPSSAAPGQVFVLAGSSGSPDIVYHYIRNSSGNYEWVEATRAI